MGSRYWRKKTQFGLYRFTYWGWDKAGNQQWEKRFNQTALLGRAERKCGQYYHLKAPKTLPTLPKQAPILRCTDTPQELLGAECKNNLQAQTVKCWLKSSLSPSKVLISNFKMKRKQGCGTFRLFDTEIPGYKAWLPSTHRMQELAGWAPQKRPSLCWAERKLTAVQEFNYRGKIDCMQVTLDWMDWTLER